MTGTSMNPFGALAELKKSDDTDDKQVAVLPKQSAIPAPYLAKVYRAILMGALK